MKRLIMEFAVSDQETCLRANKELVRTGKGIEGCLLLSSKMEEEFVEEGRKLDNRLKGKGGRG